jgi:hypothetical protein
MDRLALYDRATTTQTRCLDRAAVADETEAASRGRPQLQLQFWYFPTH